MADVAPACTADAEPAATSAGEERRRGARPDFRHDLAKNHNNLGVLLKDMGRTKEAEVLYRDALALHEQLVWRTSYELSIVTVVCAPSFDAPCAVASMVKPFSEAIVRMSPLLRKGRLYATVGPPEP